VARIDPLTRGDLFHRVQCRFLSDPVNQSIDAILDEEAANIAEQLAPAIPQLWEASIEAIRTDLHGWLIPAWIRSRTAIKRALPLARRRPS
jgi:hypothetical protein